MAFDGESITYDGAGNPTSYYNGTRWTMAWEEGRRLVSAGKTGTSLTFTYDSEGLRLTKKVGSTTYSYLYAGGKLMRQTGGGNTLDFFYDASGMPYAVKYNGTVYYYITNLQGDVLHIVNASGTPVVSYTYDPYGKPLTTTGSLASTLGAHNPLRYRGYVYDNETGLYYLQSRYYDPSTGRFINADALASTGQGILGYNMFAYCNDNPVNFSDLTGTIALPTPTLADYYGMHKAVQYDIVEERGYGMEVPVVGPNGAGRLDLYDGETNTYYEVKHIFAAQGPMFDFQMEKYDASHVVGWRFREYEIDGKVSRGSAMISGNTTYLHWDIMYRSTDSGVIVYRWVLNRARYEQALAVTAMAIAGAAYCNFVIRGGFGVEHIIKN